jgi:two-component system OmpR family sensor kinase
MKIFKSIKWRLQLWYGLVLVAVLAGFGFSAYQLERNQLFGRIDGELHQRVGILANVLHRPPPPPRRPEQDFFRPPPDQFPNDGPPTLQKKRPLSEFHLPPEDAHFFDASDPHGFYFTITSLNLYGHKVIARSTNQPNQLLEPIIITKSAHQVNRVDQVFPAPELPKNTSKPPKIMSFGNYRETVDMLPSGEMIEVGCSIAPEMKELRLVTLTLAGVGAAILLLGLMGGWWLVGRAIRPIEDISATAVKISAGDLSQRINVAETESELGRLASVLNSTFARLETAFAQQQQFTSDAAHELRTPVSVMLTQTQTALNRERNGSEYRETLEACQRASQRMRKLIESLLELARLDAGQETLKRLRFNLSQVIADCLELVRPLAYESGVKIVSELAPLDISGDSERLAQVVTNLLANAIQYNQSGGETRVKLESQGGLAVLTVADTGPGISADDLPHVFERFYRGDKSRTGSNGNAGLGLAISKAIVEAHGGTIEVSSKPGIGTTFTVRLPIT